MKILQKKLSCYCRCNDIVMVAYSPFGSFGNAVAKKFKNIFEDKAVTEVAKEIGCKPSQVSEKSTDI